MSLVSTRTALAVLALLTFSTDAAERQKSELHMAAYTVAGSGGSNITSVARGQELAIECGNIASPGADVNVVMALDPIQGNDPDGYGAVLLTDSRIGGNAVHVRVPNMPGLAHHTVALRVYVTDAHGTTACNAGHLRIG